MKIKFRAVRLRAHTADVAVGSTLRFEDGLNVVRGDNSRGKTQALQAIIYSLGLEGMFGPARSSGLGSAMTHEVRLPPSDASTVETAAAVLSSWCAVEIENTDGDVLTAQRVVKHDVLHSNLVRVWNGPALTDGVGDGSEPQARFVREPGAAQREHGFHHQLERFLGWQLPQVPRYAGPDVQLYIETIAPFLYVDQRAWGTAAPRAVTQFQIREPTRRAAEFLLGLTGPKAQSRRFELETRLGTLRTEWSGARASAQTTAAVVGGRATGIPESPSGLRGGTRQQVEPTDASEARLELLDEGEWHPAESVLQSLRVTTVETSDEAALPTTPSVDEVGIESLRQQLRDAEVELGDVLATAAAVEQTVSLAEAELAALDRRIDALTDEQARNRDVKTLLRLGAEDHQSHLADDECPTCRQSLAGVESEDLGPVLDVDGTLGLLAAQLATSRGMREQAHVAAEQARNAYSALQREADNVRIRVRALRSDLTAPGDYPSIGAVTRRVSTDLRVAELARASATFSEHIERLQVIANEIAAIRTESNALPTETPSEDLGRIQAVTTSMHDQLNEFGFSSYDREQIGLDEETLRPRRIGFDIDTDVSATDVVRIKIAYLNSIREIGFSADTPHPGLLILDEPRQHELDEQHFRATLRRLARADGHNHQVIVTSAAGAQALLSMLNGARANVIDLGSARLLQLEEQSDPLDLPVS